MAAWPSQGGGAVVVGGARVVGGATGEPVCSVSDGEGVGDADGDGVGVGDFDGLAELDEDGAFDGWAGG
jgi:hypothetical protein